MTFLFKAVLLCLNDYGENFFNLWTIKLECSVALKCMKGCTIVDLLLCSRSTRGLSMFAYLGARCVKSMLVPALQMKPLLQRDICTPEASFQLKLLLPEQALLVISDVGNLCFCMCLVVAKLQLLWSPSICFIVLGLAVLFAWRVNCDAKWCIVKVRAWVSNPRLRKNSLECVKKSCTKG